jgi:hypothetical protein
MPGPKQDREPLPPSSSRRDAGYSFLWAVRREQEAYFAIGELTQDEMQDLRRKPLAEALERMRRERAGGTEGIAAGKHHRLSGVDETEPLALTNS